jgi:hypothetical protein
MIALCLTQVREWMTALEFVLRQNPSKLESRRRPRIEETGRLGELRSMQKD